MSITPGAVTDPLFAIPQGAVATLPQGELSDQEMSIASWLTQRLFSQRAYLELHELYYNGMQRMQDLGLSIPPTLNMLRTVIGWPRIGIDALSNRCKVEGFRFPGSTQTDSNLWEIWQANNLDAEAQLAHLDALIFGRAYIIVGTRDPNSPLSQWPLITAESPVNMTAQWDARMRRCTSALQVYLDTDFTSDMYGQEMAVLYTPNSTIWMGRQASQLGLLQSQAPWTVVDRDDHGLDIVPVVRMSNRQRLGNRDGLSEITPEWMNTTDSATRTLLGMELAREFYAAPRRYVLGASEDAFQAPDGSAVSAWETYMSKVWAIDADEEGNKPTVGEFATGNPANFTNLIDTYAKIMAGEMGVPMHFLGITADGNPASADAIRSGYEELTVRSRNKHNQFGDAWEEAMRIAIQISGEKLPTGAYQMETDWADPSPTTPESTSAAIFQQVSQGSIPATSDVTLKRLGYSAVERLQLAEDRSKDQGEAAMAELTHSLLAKEARVDTGLVQDVAPSATIPGTGPGSGVPASKAPVPPANSGTP